MSVTNITIEANDFSSTSDSPRNSLRKSIGKSKRLSQLAPAPLYVIESISTSENIEIENASEPLSGSKGWANNAVESF
jgi:hypothetical protein